MFPVNENLAKIGSIVSNEMFEHKCQITVNKIPNIEKD